MRGMGQKVWREGTIPSEKVADLVVGKTKFLTPDSSSAVLILESRFFGDRRGNMCIDVEFNYAIITCRECLKTRAFAEGKPATSEPPSCISKFADLSKYR